MNLYRLSRKLSATVYDDFNIMIVWAENETDARCIAAVYVERFFYETGEWHVVNSAVWLDPERTEVLVVELDKPKVIEACFRHG